MSRGVLKFSLEIFTEYLTWALNQVGASGQCAGRKFNR